MDHALPTAPTPFDLALPQRQTAPLVFASPHSGRLYPSDFVDAARLDAHALRASEDGYVDELFAGVVRSGAPLLAATFPRAYCDANREPWELDPGMFADALPPWVNTTSARVGAGLGTLARVVATGEGIYRGKLEFREAEFRVGTCWAPFHARLAALIEDTRAAFGACLLVDCHSMPANAGRGVPPDIVLGDAHGTACAGPITALAETTLTALGYVVRRNDPYAGGYITRHYGRPREGVHALQVELARSLYMEEAQLVRGPGFAKLQADLATFAATLAREAHALLR